MDYNNGIIRLFRGDSYSQPLPINIGTKLDPIYYNLTENDTLYFGLMEPNTAFEEAVVRKSFSMHSDKDNKGNILLKLSPQDTVNLTVGKYYYMVKLRSIDEFDNEHVKTIIPLTQFWLEGNNVDTDGNERYETGKYDIEHIIYEGGEITDEGILFEGGELEFDA